jgi:hypothetical protein
MIEIYLPLKKEPVPRLREELRGLLELNIQYQQGIINFQELAPLFCLTITYPKSSGEKRVTRDEYRVPRNEQRVTNNEIQKKASD